MRCLLLVLCCCLLCTECSLLHGVVCSLRADCWLLRVACSLLVVLGSCLPFAIHCAWFEQCCCLSCVAAIFLFVDRCLLLVVRFCRLSCVLGN